MRVVMDVTTLCAPRPSGVGVYVHHLFSALADRTDVDLRGMWNATRLRGGRHRHLPAEIARCSSPDWPLVGHLRALAARTLVHGPDFRLPRWAGVPQVVTIHDLASFQPGFLPADHAARARRRLNRLARRRPAAVIADTGFVAHELAGRFPALAGRIHTVHLGCDHLPAAPPAAAAADPPYFLFVGNVERRKNVSGVVRAFTALAARVPEVRLLVVGQPGHGGTEIDREIAASPAAARIDRRTWLPSGELPGIYAGARGLVYPSWYEGFGFPVLEAMWLGCPVITSDRGAMAEVAGGAALLVDPADTEEMVEAMGLLLQDGDRHEDLVRRGRAHAGTFTWAACAERTSAVYAAVHAS